MKKQIIPVAFIFLTLASYAQSLTPTLVSTAGGTGTTSEISLDWSLGEIAVSHNSNTINLSEGLHQTYLITTKVLDQQPYFDISLFPNPTSESIQIKKEQVHELSLHVYDTVGRLIKTMSIYDDLTIQLNGWHSGNYIFMFRDDKGHIESHKVTIQ